MKTLLRAAASLGLLALVFWFAGPARILDAFGRAEPFWLVAALVSAFASGLTGALRWHAMAGWLGLDVPRGECVLGYYRGFAANTVLPGATLSGDALRAVHLQRLGHPLGVSAASVALDRMSGLWVLVALSLAMTTAAQWLGLVPPALLPLPLAATIAVTLAVLSAPTLLWLASVAWHAHLPQGLEHPLAALHGRPRPFAHFIAQLGWSAGVQAFAILAFALGGRAVGLDLPPWLFVIAAGPVFVLAALPVSVGGWGTREAAAAVTLGHFGAPAELAVAAAMLYGLFAAVQGGVGALTFLRQEKT